MEVTPITKARRKPPNSSEPTSVIPSGMAPCSAVVTLVCTDNHQIAAASVPAPVATTTPSKGFVAL